MCTCWLRCCGGQSTLSSHKLAINPLPFELPAHRRTIRSSLSIPRMGMAMPRAPAVNPPTPQNTSTSSMSEPFAHLFSAEVAAASHNIPSPRPSSCACCACCACCASIRKKITPESFEKYQIFFLQIVFKKNCERVLFPCLYIFLIRFETLECVHSESQRFSR